MKNILAFVSIIFFLSMPDLHAQVFSSVTVTGFNLDAVVENTTAASTTGGAIDGSDYVMYSAAYAANYSGATGLPNTGLIASGTRTYQLQAYTQSNMLYLTGGQADSLVFTN